jgi:hypothetical protein
MKVSKTFKPRSERTRTISVIAAKVVRKNGEDFEVIEKPTKVFRSDRCRSADG